MGGLRKGLPITYWTFLIGAIAIAGVPPLAGFFSKDEILWRTFSNGHQIMWIIGLVTSVLTATDMFRLVFLTFHGERRHDAPAPASPHGAHGVSAGPGHAGDHSPGHGSHGGGHHLHDAPAPMALALIVLAVGSVFAGFVGIPHALGGSNRIEAFLEPSFEAHAMAPATEFQISEGRREATTPAEPAHEAPEADHGNTELMLMALSSGIAVAGIGLAWFFWLRTPYGADAIAKAMKPVHALLLNKYWIDELYNAVIVQPIKQISTFVLWKGADAGLIDGTVNGVGAMVRGTSGGIRRLQTGSVRAYAASLFIGVVLILAYYLFRS
jgi:NADH-quinone oxidoreductase subunit L